MLAQLSETELRYLAEQINNDLLPCRGCTRMSQMHHQQLFCPKCEHYYGTNIYSTDLNITVDTDEHCPWGYVYTLVNTRRRRYKIGKTIQPIKVRIAQVNQEYGMKFTAVDWFYTPSPLKVERYILGIFQQKGYNVTRELFRL